MLLTGRPSGDHLPVGAARQKRDANAFELAVVVPHNTEALLVHPAVDTALLTTTNLREVQRLFDSEARAQMTLTCQEKIIHSGGIYIQPRHTSLMVDTVTFEAYATAIDRYGSAKKASTTPTTQISSKSAARTWRARRCAASTTT